MQRYLETVLKQHLGKKILILSGPRQVGKTYLAKSLSSDFSYYNYDIRKDLSIFKNQEWDDQTPLVIFDEIHKMKKWKLWLKGLYDDGRFNKQFALITGSARLEFAKKVGDSLAGRHFSFRLNPLDLKELKNQGSVESNYKKLLERSGFPEPFLSKDPNFYKLWRRSHTDTIIKQDLLSLEVVKDLDSLEVLIELLAQRVGSTISLKALSKDLQVSDKTISRWLRILEDLYIVFRVTPYTKNIPRSLLKASKYYFYDVSRVEGDEAKKLENLVAFSLKKELDFLADAQGSKSNFHFLRTKDHKEVDFFVQMQNQKPLLIEVKLSESQISSSLYHFAKNFPGCKKYQWVKNLDRVYTSKEGVRVTSALEAMAALDLTK